MNRSVNGRENYSLRGSQKELLRWICSMQDAMMKIQSLFCRSVFFLNEDIGRLVIFGTEPLNLALN